MSRTAVTALWRRLDAPGHDAARLAQAGRGWRLDGTVVCEHARVPCALTYRVDCDATWRTVHARVTGWASGRPLRFECARRRDGRWLVDGSPVRGLRECEHVDFGFTPATNLLQLRCAALAVGDTARFSVAWLDVGSRRLAALPQSYTRRSATTYWYESPIVGYAALLELAPHGFVRRYPGLWRLVEPGSRAARPRAT